MTAVVDYIVSFFLKGSYYHFWYFVCLIYGVILLFAMLCVLGIRWTGILACICYGMKCLMYGYSWIGIPGLSVFAELYDKFSGVTDAVCLAIPFMMVGVVAAKAEQGIWQKVCRYRYVGLAVASLALITEASVLRFVWLRQSNYS